MRAKNRLAMLIGLGITLLMLAVFGRALANPRSPSLTTSLYLPVIYKPDAPTVTPTATPTATPTSTQPAPPTPPENWLARLNYYRAMASLPPVTENTDWSNGDVLHSRYCVKNDYIGHTEDINNTWYSDAGKAAAENGNVTVSSSSTRPDWSAIDSWMTGPFHGVGMIDPRLAVSGFGSYREADGGWQMAATLDVIRGRGSIPGSVTFPIMWPGNGTTTFLTSYGGSESPDPLSSCTGYSAPSGLPIILQIGSGSTTPSVTAHSVLRNGAAIDHCVFDETNYTNSNASYQSLGRSVLGSRDAIVIIPRDPLTPGSQYTISVTTNGQTHTWTFSVASSVSTNVLPQGDDQIR